VALYLNREVKRNKSLIKSLLPINNSIATGQALKQYQNLNVESNHNLPVELNSNNNDNKIEETIIEVGKPSILQSLQSNNISPPSPPPPPPQPPIKCSIEEITEKTSKLPSIKAKNEKEQKSSSTVPSLNVINEEANFNKSQNSNNKNENENDTENDISSSYHYHIFPKVSPLSPTKPIKNNNKKRPDSLRLHQDSFHFDNDSIIHQYHLYADGKLINKNKNNKPFVYKTTIKKNNDYQINRLEPLDLYRNYNQTFNSPVDSLIYPNGCSDALFMKTDSALCQSLRNARDNITTILDHIDYIKRNEPILIPINTDINHFKDTNNYYKYYFQFYD
jgi:hypothetical protein